MNILVTGLLLHGAHILQSLAQMEHIALILHSLFSSLFLSYLFLIHGIAMECLRKDLKGQGEILMGRL